MILCLLGPCLSTSWRVVFTGGRELTYREGHS